MPNQPIKNEDGSWSHPALPGLSFRLRREAQAAAHDSPSPPPYIPRF